MINAQGWSIWERTLLNRLEPGLAEPPGFAACVRSDRAPYLDRPAAEDPVPGAGASRAVSASRFITGSTFKVQAGEGTYVYVSA